MGTIILNSGTGTFGDAQVWSVNETVTPLVVGDTSAGLGDASFTVTRTTSTDLLNDNKVTVQHPVLGKAAFSVKDVTLMDKTVASFTADSIFAPFITGTIRIPAIESGSPIASLDMACQLSGMRRSNDNDARSVYWSLVGHSVGFDFQGNRVTPSSVTKIFNEPNLYARADIGPIPYEEILNFVSVGKFVGLYPSLVTGGTPRISTARMYVKFKTVDLAGSHQFTYTTGPDVRWVDYKSVSYDVANTVTVNYERASNTLTATITYPDDLLNPATVTASVSTSALATTIHTVAVDTGFTAAGTLSVRAAVCDELGTMSAIAEAVVPGASSILTPTRAGQFTITATGSSVRDLLVRETALATSVLPAFCAPSYAVAAPYLNSLSSAHAGSPIAATTGEVWDYLKQVAAARQVEFTATPSGITAREVRQTMLDVTDVTNLSCTISTTATGRNVAVVNKNTSISNDPVDVYSSTQVLSVAAGAVTTSPLSGVADGVTFLYNPYPATPLQLGADFAPTPYETARNQKYGYYYIIGADNLPVPAAEWLSYGGSVEANIIADGSAQIVLTGPRVAIPGAASPYRLALASNSTVYPQLYLRGVGVLSKPYTVTLPTGADPRKTNVELASTIDNVAVSDLVTVYNAGAFAVARAAGPIMTVTATIPVINLPSFGFGVGSTLAYGKALFRVDNVAISSAGTVSVSASKYTTIADYQALGLTETLTAFRQRWAPLSCNDYAVRPLSTVALLQ